MNRSTRFQGRGCRIRFFLFLLMTSVFLATGCSPVTAGTAAPVPSSTPPKSPAATPSVLSLNECVRLVLTQSPYMKLHDLTIDIKGIDADDAWYQMFPKINLALTSNTPINKGKNSDESSFSVTLSSGSYDPITAKISHDARLKLIQLAKYAKLETATDLIKNTAGAYLSEKMHAERMQYFDELLKLARENLAYVAQNYPDAPTVPLDVRLAQYKIDQLQAEKTRLETTRRNQQMQLKRLLGIPIEQKLEFQTENLAETLFRSFAPGKLAFSQIRAHSIKAKMEKLSMELADNNILAAWAKYVPKFNFSIRTPDPINDEENKKKDDSYYFTLGVSAPLWHWGELGRGRERAKLQKRQAKLQYQAQWMQLEDDWYTLRSNMQLLRDSCTLADTETELHTLGVRKAEIMFNVGRIQYNDYLATQTTLLRDKMDAVTAQERYLMAKLDAFAKSGQLLRRFVTVTDNTDENN